MPTLAEIEKEIKSVYSQAEQEIEAKWNAYLDEVGKKTDKLWREYKNATAIGDKEAANKALYEFQRNVQNMTLQSDRYKAMVKETAAQITNANMTAVKYANGQMAGIYTAYYNELADVSGLAKIGYSFTLVDEATVKNLITSGGSLLPDPSKRTLAEILQKTIDTGKDARWNIKKINSQVLQGILQGESVDKIAKRLQSVTDMNEASAIRNARTMTTNAENKGRVDSYRQAESDGVILKKVWIATDDDRTRVEHAGLDGQEVDVDDVFEVDGYTIEYPGDPAADPCMVYNCRCSIKTRVVGFKNHSQVERDKLAMPSQIRGV